MERNSCWPLSRLALVLGALLLLVATSACSLLAPIFAPLGHHGAPTAVQSTTAAKGADPGTTSVPNLDPGRVAAPGASAKTTSSQAAPIVLSGRFEPPAGIYFAQGLRRVQATSADVVTGATVTLLGPGNQAVATGLTDASGNWSLSLSGFAPANNGTYVVEVVKGLQTNSPGQPAARFRTIVEYTTSGATSGWLSCTNSTLGGQIVIDANTTAVALEIALDSTLSPTLAIGKVSAGPPSTLNSTPSFPNHPDTEITALASDLTTYLTNNLDPVGSVAAIKPTIALNTTQGFPGTLVTITGQGFSPVSGGNTVTFGSAVANVYLATATELIASVPAGASSGNVTVATARGGTSNGVYFTVTAGVTVAVNPSGITAPYYVAGAETVPQPGARNVTLYPGTSQIVFSTGQAATFVVAANGTVDGTLSNGALVGGANTVTFQTTTLTIQPNGYAGNYQLGGGFMSSAVVGNGSALLLKGLLGYQLVAGTTHYFDVDSAGNVSPRTSWASGGANSLTFANISLQINANGFTGNWQINGVDPTAQSGTITLSIPKDSTSYVMNVLGTTFTFDISSTGVVSTTSSYATGGTDVLTLN
ncbi:MAG: IPT/TIG domain-containing protein, partial [Cyanobacteria bacterium REEB65]|nr:IPT/TIG domain-containing protein [Cyanobacteria bacterium REEB65]